MRRGILLIPDNDEDEQKIIEFWTGQTNNQSNPEQKKIVQEPVCSKCGKAVDQKVVNFCRIKYKGTILCRDCQEGA